MSTRSKPAVFLDRDGTIIRSFKGRPANTVDEIELLPGVPDGMREIKSLNLAVVMITNQGGVGLGYMTIETLKEMNERVNDLLILAKAPPIDAAYWCPHRPDEGCECRKPRPGMLLKAAEDLNIDLSRSYFVGDDVRDMEAAVCAGIKWPLMVVSDMYRDTPLAKIIFPTFKEAAHAIYMLESAR